MKKYILTESELRELPLESIMLEMVVGNSPVDVDDIIEAEGVDIDDEVGAAISDFAQFE